MFEIIPNWHPIFVHFTVALFSTSVGFYTLAYLLPKFKLFPKLAIDFEMVARGCLWVAGFMAVATVLAGLYAYNTVRHDAPSHLAMTDHRNWAIPMASAMVLVVLWSLWRTYKHKPITVNFIMALFIVQGLLLSTAWRGAELVYRYGLGVISLPKPEDKDHNHQHGTEMEENKIDHLPMPPTGKLNEHSGHQNDSVK